MDLPLDADSYIPRIKFTDDENALAIMTLNRHQNRFDLYFANPRSTLCKLMVRDEAPQYIKEEAYSNIVFYPKNFVVMSEKTVITISIFTLAEETWLSKSQKGTSK